MLSAPPARPKSASPSCQRLHDRHDGLRARSAEAVDVHRGHRVGHARAHRGHAGEVHVARFGVDDVAEGDMADLRALDAGALERGGGGDRPSSIGGTAARLPPKVPMAVRAAPRITMSVMGWSSLSSIILARRRRPQ
jgi:hypothetical protein